jgi:AcrR family transcriptional regulator
VTAPRSRPLRVPSGSAERVRGGSSADCPHAHARWCCDVESDGHARLLLAICQGDFGRGPTRLGLHRRDRTGATIRPMAKTQTHRRSPARGEGRDAILDAVERITARGGLDALTYRSVAAEAGVTHGLLSYHFSSRDSMINEALVRAARRAIQSSVVGSVSNSVDQFAAGLSALVESDTDGQAFQHQLKLEASRRPELAGDVQAMRHMYLGSVAGALERLGLPPDEPLARLVLAALDGLVMQQLVFRRPDYTDAAVDRLHALLKLAVEHGLDS